MKLLCSILLLSNCAIPNTIIEIKSTIQYQSLDNYSNNLLNEILNIVEERNDNKYYYNKLYQLLITPVNPETKTATNNSNQIEKSLKYIKQKQEEILQKASSKLSKYENREEKYQFLVSRNWFIYQPIQNDAYYYTVIRSPLDILVYIQVRISGDPKVIEKITMMEDAIEKHLSVIGYSVNLKFVSYDGPDVFNVASDLSQWATSHNWAGNHKTLAHELLHLMGLPDEYDRIENHATNRNMKIKQRLEQFYMQLVEGTPPDAKNGIMCNSNRKPLHRHICASVGLGKKCATKRKLYYNE